MPKSKPQIDAFPQSKNMAERQSPRTKAVVAIRMLGGDIAKLDAEAARLSESRTVWNKATRTTVIETALKQYFEALAVAAKDSNTGRKGTRRGR